MSLTTKAPVTPRRLAAVLSALALAGGAAACSSGTTPAPAPAASSTSAAPTEAATSAAPSPSETTASPTTSPSPSSASPSAAADNSALLAAGSTARKARSGSTVTAIESERGGWEVTVVTDDGDEYSRTLAANGTDLTSSARNERPDSEDRAENRRLARVDVSYREAVRIVEREVDGGQIREINLDVEDNGRIDWEADVTAGSQKRVVEIDADSGKVISNRVDD